MGTTERARAFVQLARAEIDLSQWDDAHAFDWLTDALDVIDELTGAEREDSSAHVHADDCDCSICDDEWDAGGPGPFAAAPKGDVR